MIARAAEGEFVRWDTPIYGRAGGKETIIIDASLTPVRDEEGRVVFIAAEGRDITEKKAYEREIARQREELAELDKLKTQFFANISHEFRTPLTLMMGPLEDALADAEGLSAPNRERLELARRNAARQLKLVNTLLDFSRIEAGRIQASYEPTDLAGLTAELSSLFRSAVEKAGMRLVVDCPPLPEPVYVDREMWEKIVLNLLSNAFKFTLEGEIKVGLRLAGEAVELSVSDTGTGIPAEELPHLFERFHRVRDARGRSYEGSGIGLALVQELVRLHGGSVRVESELRRGSTFTLRIPRGTAHLPQERIGAARTLTSTGLRGEVYVEEVLRWLPEEARGQRDRGEERSSNEEVGFLPSPRPPAHPSRVLLADDNADMREYVSRLLAQGGYEVEAVADGLAALNAARERPPELVLADVMMPGLDGFELLAALRSDERTRTLPVILLSARAGEEARVEGIEAGADDYLTKPFSARELLARAESHIQLQRVRRAVERAVAESEARFRTFVTASSDVVYRMSPDWGEMRQLQGREFIADTNEPSGEWLAKYIYPEDQEKVLAAIREAVRTKGKFELEHRVLRPDGAPGWTFSRAIPILDADGQVVEWLGAASDVTRRKEAEEALRNSEEKYRTVLASMDEGLMIAEVLFDASGETAVDYIVLETNEAFYKHTGLPQGMVGKTIHEIVPGGDIPWLGVYGEVALTGRPIRFEYEIKIEPLAGWYDIFIQRIGDPAQRHVAVIFQDITERKRAEANLNLLAALSEHLLVLSTSAEIMRAFGEGVGSFLGASVCAFVEVNEAADEALIKDEWQREGGRSLVGWYGLPEYVTEEFRALMSAGRVVVVHDSARDERVRDKDKFAALKIGSFVGCVAKNELRHEGAWPQPVLGSDPEQALDKLRLSLCITPG